LIASKFEFAGDMLELAYVNKTCYHLMQEPAFRSAISFPFYEQFKLTTEQFACLKKLLAANDDSSPRKIVSGDVGSGKTWLAVAYLAYKMKTYEPGTVKAILIVPPSLVAQWSDFIKIHTNLKVESNCDSSCFYVRDRYAEETSIYLTSPLKSTVFIRSIRNRGLGLIVIHDECHSSPAVIANAGYVRDYLGMSANHDKLQKNTLTSRLPIFTLQSIELREDLPPFEVVMYESCGYNQTQKAMVNLFLRFSDRGYLQNNDVGNILTRLTYGSLQFVHFTFYHTKNRKRLVHNSQWVKQHPDDFKSETDFMLMLEDTPKLMECVRLALSIKEKGEKLILFDVSADLLVGVHYLLLKYGLKSYLYSTQYPINSRNSQITKFKQNGDVLLGSIAMLAEGHNIVEANHIAFLRYPDKPEAFVQAIGRCHRYPQKKTVYLHLIHTCKLEENLALLGMDQGYTKIHLDDLQHADQEFLL
ncbi:MAG: helicase-related protein, partial [Candidatus Roizmanbacteria bacterium]